MGAIIIFFFFFFPNNLKAIRKSKGLTQQQLADLSGISRVAIARYETNKQTPKMSALEKLAQALGVSVEELNAPLELKQEPEPTAEKAQEVSNNTSKISVTKEAYNKANERAKAAIKKRYSENMLNESSVQPLKKENEVDALAQTIHDEIVNEIMKSFSKDTIKDYIYAALEKRLKESAKLTDQNTKK